MTSPDASPPRCPLCDSPDLRATVRREALPVMQNVVFTTRDEALRAARAPLTLSVCGACGFAFNSCFDPSVMVYDARYDNDVPSAAFERYYRDIALSLASRHGVTRGAVCDVGCGKGRFLEVFTEAVPAVTGLGIDPSCAAREATPERAVTLVSDVFRPEHVATPPALVVCRHTLEHIPSPLPFLRSIHAALAGAPDAPLFFEVPDLDWILDHGAFWDFCYEHCNYFTKDSLARALTLAGFAVDEVTTAFGGQYLHAHARRRDVPPWPVDADAAVARASAYAVEESRRVESARRDVESASAEGRCVLWGMATKGVIFANLVDPEGVRVAGGVDINVKKQGRFTPVTAHAIHAPEWLRGLGGRALAVWVMNPNYADEIQRACDGMGVRARLVAV